VLKHATVHIHKRWAKLKKMTENEKWVDELEKLIVEESDKILFQETANCFLTGNLRASYIMSWITIIESLKRKIKLFSNLGDSRATDAYSLIEKTEEDKKSTDRLIFEESKKCGIIDNADLSTINFLWEQRCLFAHPYNRQPEEDEVKHIIGQTIKLVLAKELFYNKDFLSELSDNIANKPFFLPTEIERIRDFASRTIARTPEELHPFLFKTLLFKVGELAPNQEKFSELKKLRYYLIELFVKTSISLEDPSWSLENRVTNFPFECYIGFVHKDSWSKLPIRIKEMLISYLVNETDNNRLVSLKSITVKLVSENILEADLKEKYIEKLNDTYFDSAINFYGDNDLKFKRIKTELESWQYEQQNPVIDYLREEGTFNFLNSISNENQFCLGRLLKSCSSGGHWKTQYLLSSIISGSTNTTDYVKAGIAYGGIVSWTSKYHLDKEFLTKSIQLLNQIEIPIQQSTYDKIYGILAENTPDEFDKMTFSEPAIIELSANILGVVEEWKESNKANFETLIENIKENFAQQ